MIIELRDKRGGRTTAMFDDDEPLVGGRMFIDKNGYVYRKRKVSGKIKEFSFARLVLGLANGDPRQADHINRNPLDNRRVNLRIVTRAQQAENKGAQRRNASGLRGAQWDRAAQRWKAAVRPGGALVALGYYDTAQAAACAARAYRSQHMPYSYEG